MLFSVNWLLVPVTLDKILSIVNLIELRGVLKKKSSNIYYASEMYLRLWD